MKSFGRSKAMFFIGLIVAVVLAVLFAAGLAENGNVPAAAETRIEAVAGTDAEPAAGETEAEDAAQPAEAESDPVSGKAIAAGIAIGLAAAAGAVGMGIAIAKSNEAIARQPEATGNIRSTLMLGLILIETAIIYALIISILIIFAL